MQFQAVPLTRKEVNAFIEEHHRHHPPTQADKFRVGAIDTKTGKLVGVANVGRPVARALDDGTTLEVTRLCTTGERNVCSFPYSRCARIAKEMGYRKIITYILESEDGTSLKASGWEFEHLTSGRSWDTPSRRRQTKAPTCNKKRFGKDLTR